MTPLLTFVRRPAHLILACGIIGGLLGSVFAFSLRNIIASILSPDTEQYVSRLRETPVTVPVQRAPQPVDCAREPCIALTFDDGPNPITTPYVLDVLDRHEVRASFFLVGSRVEGQEELVRRMFYAGHEIGNHSWNHPDFTQLTPEEILNQIYRTQAAISAADVPAPKTFRPPYGSVNATVKTTVPLTIALWNVDPLDWHGYDHITAAEILVSQSRSGAIIDLHDIYHSTAYSLEPAIIELKKHYKLVTFSELTNIQPGQQGVYYGR